MNYAAMLAVLMVLAFSFPLLVRFATDYGVARSIVVTVLFATTTFGLAFTAVRLRVTAYRTQLERLGEARARIALEPTNPRAYFVHGEHVALLLLRLGRRREASELIDRYAQLGGARESEILALRAALSRAERRQRRTA